MVEMFRRRCYAPAQHDEWDVQDHPPRHPERSEAELKDLNLIKHNPTIDKSSEKAYNDLMKSSKKGYIYILSNKTDEVLYIGVTSDLLRRLYEHRNHSVEGFTDKYNVTKVLYYEGYDLISDAIQREKQIKGWRREKKLALIKTFNPELKDMYDFLMESESGGDTSASSV